MNHEGEGVSLLYPLDLKILRSPLSIIMKNYTPYTYPLDDNHMYVPFKVLKEIVPLTCSCTRFWRIKIFLRFEDIFLYDSNSLAIEFFKRLE